MLILKLCSCLCRWATETNPQGLWLPAISGGTVLLHYAFTLEKDVADKVNRHCPPDLVAEAKKGDINKVSGNATDCLGNICLLISGLQVHMIMGIASGILEPLDCSVF